MPNRRSEPKELRSRYITYTLQRRKRKTIAIHVERNGAVRVLAPSRTPLEAVEAFVDRKSGWIDRKLKEFARLPAPAAIALREGGELPYLGGVLRLRLVRGRGDARLLLPGGGEREAQGELHLPANRNAGESAIHRKINEWYLHESRRLFAEVANSLAPAASLLGIPEPRELSTRRMRRRWGSCLPQGKIILNSELLGAPKECIAYVIAHEICHLKEANHSGRFYALMEQMEPEWRELRRRVNAEAPLGFLQPPDPS